jgi:hypothetical protein
MRHVLSIGIVLVVASLAVACGGSSSESPWPVEPEAALLGPAGEGSASPAAGSTARPDATSPDAGRPENRAE